MLYLALGFLLGTIGLVFIQAINEIILSGAELINTKIAVKIAKYNQEIQDSLNECANGQNIIGFHPIVEAEGENYYEDEEEFL